MIVIKLLDNVIYSFNFTQIHLSFIKLAKLNNNTCLIVCISSLLLLLDFIAIIILAFILQSIFLYGVSMHYKNYILFFMTFSFNLLIICSILLRLTQTITFNGFSPSNTYQVSVNAGQSITASVHFTSGSGGNFRDVDIYLYSSSANIGSLSTFQTGGTSSSNNPETFSKNLGSTQAYFIWINLSGGNPTDYNLTVTLGGSTVISDYNYVGYNSSTFSFNVGQSSCLLFVQLNCSQGWSFNLSLFAPGVADNMWNTQLSNPTTRKNEVVDLSSSGIGTYNFRMESKSASFSPIVYYQITANCDTCANYISYCQSCSSTTVCTACSSGYYVASGSSSCSLCTSLSQCLTCTSDGNCTSCSTGFFVNSSNACQSCTSIHSQCQQCSSGTVCTQCPTEYYVDSSNNCTICAVTIPYCTLCTNSSYCTLCSNLSLLNTLSNSCVQCDLIIPNCLQCTNISSISQCMTCISTLYYVDSFYQCSLCNVSLQNCITCNSQAICITCDSLYYVNGSFQCDNCNYSISYCYNCSGDGALCFQCMPMYFLATANTTCQLCSAYISHCILCTNATFCTSCQSTFFVDATNLCTLCFTPQQGCLICSDAITCLTVINATYFINSSNMSVKCQIAISNCNQCISETMCHICESQYFELNGSCLICQDYIDFCSICANGTNCLVCNDSQFEVVSDGSCQCIAGWIVTQTCTTIYGCISSRHINSNIFCLACDSQKNYFYLPNNYTCVCQTGFQQNSTGICNQICGDGIRHYESCDDGNIDNNDGCSNVCTLEPGYECIGNLNQVSICKYVQNYSPQFLYITKIGVDNQGDIVFKIHPGLKRFSQADFKKIIQINSSSQIDITSVQYSDGLLTIFFRYSQHSLRNTPIDVFFNFQNSKLVKSTSSHFLIQTNSMTPQLIYEEEGLVLRQVVFRLGQILSGLCLTLFVVSLLYHKMIGVQTLVVFQSTILMSIVVRQQTTHIFYILSSLRYLLGYIQVFPASRISLISPQRLRVYSQSQQFLTNSNIFSFTFLISSGIYLCLSLFIDYKKQRHKQMTQRDSKQVYDVKSGKTCQQKKLQLGAQIVKNNSKMELIYQRLAYPQAMFLLIPSAIFYYVNIIGSNTGQTDFRSAEYIQFFQLASIFFITFKQIKQLSKVESIHRHAVSSYRLDESLQKQYKKLYGFIFVIKSLVYCLLILLLENYFQTFSYLLFVFLGIQCFYLFTLIKIQPYLTSTHNKCLILNSLMICSFIAILIIDNVGKTSSINLSILLCCYFCGLYSIVFLAFYRVYLQFRKGKKQNKPPSKLNKQIQDSKLLTKRQKLLMQNSYLPHGYLDRTTLRSQLQNKGSEQFDRFEYAEGEKGTSIAMRQNIDVLQQIKCRLKRQFKMQNEDQEI